MPGGLLGDECSGLLLLRLPSSEPRQPLREFFGEYGPWARSVDKLMGSSDLGLIGLISDLDPTTSFPIRGGSLLSPFHDSLFGLTRNEDLSVDRKPVRSCKSNEDYISDSTSDDQDCVPSNRKMLKKRKVKLIAKSKKPLQSKNKYGVRGLNRKDDSPFRVKKTFEEKNAAGGRDILSNDTKQTPLPNSVYDARGNVMEDWGQSVENSRNVQREIEDNGRFKGNDTCAPSKAYPGASKSKKDVNKEETVFSKQRGVEKKSTLHKEDVTNILCKNKNVNNCPVSLGFVKNSPVTQDWVWCDNCQKWRVLPLGVIEHLPKKWSCSMQSWLPGMNRCEVSEDETNKVFDPSYGFPVIKGVQNLGDGTVSRLTSTHAELRVNHHHNKLKLDVVPVGGKKKHGSRVTTKIGTSSDLIPRSDGVKNHVQDAAKSRNYNDITQPPAESNLMKGGNVMKIKLKTKREADRYACEPSKISDMYDVYVERTGHLSSVSLPTKESEKVSNNECCISDCEIKDRFPVSVEKQGVQSQDSLVRAGSLDKKEGFVKKRNFKEGKCNQNRNDGARFSRGFRDLNVSSPGGVTSSESAFMALREAKVLRDKADLLKRSGFDFDSNEAYFQAALKFLHAASVIEASCCDSGMHGEMAHIQAYITSAKLSDGSAREYERHREMTSATLAYKCMEVAFMRIVYGKHSVIRDWNELHSTLLMAPQGESPSSSASDVDNLDDQATIDKSSLSKASISHVNGNRSNIVRLLDLRQHMDFAIEASKKSLSAFAAARETTQNSHGSDC